MYRKNAHEQKVADLISEKSQNKAIELIDRNYFENQRKEFESKYPTDKQESYLFRRFKSMLRSRKIHYSLNGTSLSLSHNAEEFSGLAMRFTETGYVHIWKIADDYNRKYSLFAEHVPEFIVKLRNHGLIK